MRLRHSHIRVQQRSRKVRVRGVLLRAGEALIFMAQELAPRSLGRCCRSLWPCLSSAIVVGAVGTLPPCIDFRTLQIGAALILIAFGAYRMLARHRARIGMQVSGGD
jgi:hypothetical protein